MRPPGDCFVYFVRREDGEGPVKIGCSSYPPERLQSLMTFSPYRLRIWATIPGDERLERRFHAKFEPQLSHGEWFLPSAELDAVIASVAVGEFDIAGLPEARVIRRGRVMTEQGRMEASLALRLNWMFKSGYPIPQEVQTAAQGRYRITEEVRLAKCAVVRAFVEAHHPIARQQRGTSRQRRAA